MLVVCESGTEIAKRRYRYKLLMIVIVMMMAMAAWRSWTLFAIYNCLQSVARLIAREKEEVLKKPKRYERDREGVILLTRERLWSFLNMKNKPKRNLFIESLSLGWKNLFPPKESLSPALILWFLCSLLFTFFWFDRLFFSLVYLACRWKLRNISLAKNELKFSNKFLLPRPFRFVAFFALAMALRLFIWRKYYVHFAVTFFWLFKVCDTEMEVTMKVVECLPPSFV